ncbi:MAG: Maf family protein [Bacillota bacterium]|jgi:septum formation protein
MHTVTCPSCAGSVADERRSPRLVLASASPRRSQLMQEIGLKFDVIPSQVAEGGISAGRPEELVMLLAHAKAADVAKRLKAGIVIGADTIVVAGGQVLGKPVDSADAVKMLRALSGREHQVYSGVALIDAGSGRSLTDYEVTAVRFRQLSEASIERYVATGEPMDKAGAYAIQGLGSLLVTGIRGDYNCVVGLPLGKLAIMLSEFGVDTL